MDLKISWDGVAYSGDFSPGANDDGLETAILISLFSDARARADDELPATETNRRGWWGAELLGDRQQFGSCWWMRWREKQTDETAAQFADDARDALEWMIKSNVARAMDISAAWVRRGVLGFSIVFHLTAGGRRWLEGEVAL